MVTLVLINQRLQIIRSLLQSQQALQHLKLTLMLQMLVIVLVDDEDDNSENQINPELIKSAAKPAALETQYKAAAPKSCNYNST